MGLFDKLVEKRMATMPDHAAILASALGDEGPCLAHAFVIPSAYERQSGSGNDIASQLFKRVVDAGINAVSAGRHVGGEEGTIARSLPREGDLLALALSPSHLTFWDLGMDARQVPPRLRMRLDRSAVTSIVDTGKRAQGGVPVARVTFSDDSFFDYRLMILPGPEFWREAESLST